MLDRRPEHEIMRETREAAYVTTCLEKLRELDLAMEMYQIDYGAYPWTNRWYIDLGDHMGSFEEKVDPFKCPVDNTADPTSYYYLDRSVVAAKSQP